MVEHKRLELEKMNLEKERLEEEEVKSMQEKANSIYETFTVSAKAKVYTNKKDK